MREAAAAADRAQAQAQAQAQALALAFFVVFSIPTRSEYVHKAMASNSTQHLLTFQQRSFASKAKAHSAERMCVTSIGCSMNTNICALLSSRTMLVPPDSRSRGGGRVARERRTVAISKSQQPFFCVEFQCCGRSVTQRY